MDKGRKRRPKISERERANRPAPCCKIEAVVSIDSRGQILLPKEVREKAGLRSGDRLAVISYESGEKVSRLTLVNAEEFAELAREMLGPMVVTLKEE